jgi:hypothetical protein
MTRYGLDGAIHDDWGMIDLRYCLRDGWQPIVGVDRQFFGHPESPHAIVLIEISGQTVRVFDPLGSPSPENISIETFERAWRSTGQQALVIKSPFPPETL